MQKEIQQLTIIWFIIFAFMEEINRRRTCDMLCLCLMKTPTGWVLTFASGECRLWRCRLNPLCDRNDAPHWSHNTCPLKLKLIKANQHCKIRIYDLIQSITFKFYGEIRNLTFSLPFMTRVKIKIKCKSVNQNRPRQRADVTI